MAAVLQPPTSSGLSFEPLAQAPPLIRSNEGEYIKQKSLGWLRPTAKDTTLDEMRRRFDTDGYLLIKGLIPREDVLDMREQNLQRSRRPPHPPRNRGSSLPEEQAKVNRLIEAHLTPEYLSFVAHPVLGSFVRKFMDWKNEVLVKRSMLRHNVPGGLSTGIHYDRIFLRAGEAEFLTAWVPIGDCSAKGGGLMYMEGSSQLGKEIERDFTERAKDMSPEERLSGFNRNMAEGGQLAQDAAAFGRDEGKWLTADYEAGDVVFHNPYMIHAAVKNEDFETGRIRLSTDLRFYEEGSKLDERWMQKFWTPNDGL
ncbi:hypothetical protein D0Z07_6824 [Hyphodiscus hymeniophilus]|uniref:Phytanoyl-CoA dioxygenase n=1 Tax=Hyphodiscus hymeniophilus TaxID=353542 RepID=A0A9P7AVS5_9HELO|nr:hypothetical protein D0Z07_6824 [Hyphodiscus hymeniophilus]